MKILQLTVTILIISIPYLNADNKVKTNPITTPMEPNSFLGAYTEIVLKMAEFQKEVVLILKHLNCLLYLRLQE